MEKSPLHSSIPIGPLFAEGRAEFSFDNAAILYVII